jgi:hypothetical protein
VVASRNDVREHSVQYTLALSALQSWCFDEQHGPIHTNSRCVNNAINLTAVNHVPAPALGASMARGRRRQLQMKNTFFSPTGQCFVASNTDCLVQFLSGHLGSPDETDLDTVHQTEMAPFGNAALKTRSSTGLNARSREGDRLLPPLRFLRKIQLY